MNNDLVHKFGDATSIFSALQSVDPYDGDIAEVHRDFAEWMAESEKFPEGVVLGWALSVANVERRPGSMPLLGSLMVMAFEKCMEVLLADAPDGFLSATMKFFNESLDQ